MLFIQFSEDSIDIISMKRYESNEDTFEELKHVLPGILLYGADVLTHC